jgi:hypothetical protein
VGCSTVKVVAGFNRQSDSWIFQRRARVNLSGINHAALDVRNSAERATIPLPVPILRTSLSLKKRF